MCVSSATEKRQGCATQNLRVGMHQNSTFQQRSSKNQKHAEINPPSTITNIPYFWIWLMSFASFSGILLPPLNVFDSASAFFNSSPAAFLFTADSEIGDNFYVWSGVDFRIAFNSQLAKPQVVRQHKLYWRHVFLICLVWNSNHVPPEWMIQSVCHSGSSMLLTCWAPVASELSALLNVAGIVAISYQPGSQADAPSILAALASSGEHLASSGEQAAAVVLNSQLAKPQVVGKHKF